MNDHKITKAQLEALAIAFEVLKPLLALTTGTAKQCAFCGTAFIPREPKQHYCSTKCQRDFNNNERKKRKLAGKQPKVEVLPVEPQAPIEIKKCATVGCNNEFPYNAEDKWPQLCRQCAASIV